MPPAAFLISARTTSSRHPGFVGQPVGKLVAGRRVGDVRRDAEHLLQEFTPAVVARQVVLGRRAVEQEFQVRPRPLELGDETPSRPRFWMNVSGSSPPGSEHDVHVEAFADQQLRTAFRGGLSGAIGVVAEHRLRARSAAASAPVASSAPCRKWQPPGSRRPGAPARSRSSPRRSARSCLCGRRPWSGSAHRACGSWCRSASRVSSGISGSDRLRARGRRRRSPCRCRARSGSSGGSESDRPRCRRRAATRGRWSTICSGWKPAFSSRCRSASRVGGAQPNLQLVDRFRLESTLLREVFAPARAGSRGRVARGSRRAHARAS